MQHEPKKNIATFPFLYAFRFISFALHPTSQHTHEFGRQIKEEEENIKISKKKPSSSLCTTMLDLYKQIKILNKDACKRAFACRTFASIFLCVPFLKYTMQAEAADK